MIKYQSLSDSNLEIICTKIECYNTTPSAMILIFYSLDNTEIYRSDKIDSSHILKLDLNSTILSVNSHFKLGYILSDSSSSSSSSSSIVSDIFKYVPDSNATSYFALKYPPYSFSYTGVVPPFYYPNADPYLKCSGLVYKNNATAYVTLEYDPVSNVTAHFQFTGSAFKTILIYEGTE